MSTMFARMRPQDDDMAMLECIFNRDLERMADPELLYIVLSDEVSKKYDVDTELGELLVYSPFFEPELGCMWVAQSIDFDFVDPDQLGEQWN